MVKKPLAVFAGERLALLAMIASERPNELLLIGVPGFELDAATAARIRKLQPGGFILFGRNIESAQQLRKLTDDLRDISATEPIITIDQEGGRVSRLRLIGHEPPNAQQFRERGDLSLIQTHGRITGELLRLFGFNLDLCPVLDISFDDEADNSLRGRCYGSSVEETITNAEAFRAAMTAAGILSCGKHFPGYTFAGLDPHHELPCIDRSRAELDACELAVFRAFASRVDSMMIGHAHYPCFEPNGAVPASLSPAVIRECLIKELGFKGLVMTDDLDMGAILNTFGWDETIRRAVHAGNHLIMICHRLEAAEDALKTLESMPAGDLQHALSGVAECKAKMAPPSVFSEAAHQALDQQVWDLRVATLGEERAQTRSAEDGKRSPVEIY